MKPKKYTNIKQVTFRAGLTLTIIILLITILATSSAYALIKSGEINNRIVNPIKKNIDSISKALEAPIPTMIPDPTAEPTIEPTEAPAPTVVIIYKKSVSNDTYKPPTYATPKPGELGSKEWIDNFNKEFNDAQKRTQETIQKQQQFCKDNPSLCN